jgi:hypothetical protein
MKSIKFLFLSIVLFAFIPVSAQKMAVKSGDLSKLKGVSELKIVFDYSATAVGEFETMDAYVQHRYDEYEADEPGKGEKWKGEWYNDRETRDQVKFEEQFSKYSKKFDGSRATESDVVMTVKTLFIEIGFDVVAASRPSVINLDIIFSDADGEFAVVSIEKAKGYGWMIDEAYSLAGKQLGKFLDKEVQ